MNIKNKYIYNFFDQVIKSSVIDENSINKFQEYVFDQDKISNNDEIEELVRELAYDLDFFESDVNARKEDSSYFGEQEALELIQVAYSKIKSIK